MTELPPEALKLIEDTNLAHFVTLMKDGSPQVTPVWVDFADGYVRINTAKGRQKPLNLDRDRRVALSIVDHTSPYHYVAIRGRVVEVTEEGAWEHICALSQKYRNDPNYPKRPGEQRLTVKIEPLHVHIQRR